MKKCILSFDWKSGSWEIQLLKIMDVHLCGYRIIRTYVGIVSYHVHLCGYRKYSSKLWPSERSILKHKMKMMHLMLKRTTHTVLNEIINPVISKQWKHHVSELKGPFGIMCYTIALILAMLGQKRSRRCGKCTGCTATDCKKCKFCLDM